MAKHIGVTGKLKEGDVIRVINAIRSDKFSFYRVNRTEGNRAFTKFRDFHVDIYNQIYVYEYGKRTTQWSNTYIVSNETEAKKANAEIQ